MEHRHPVSDGASPLARSLAAQTCRLPYRRLAICAAPAYPTFVDLATPCRLQVGDTADCKSALRSGLRIISALLLTVLLCGAGLHASGAEVKLTGIVSAHFGNVALVEIGPAKPILREGERLADVEVVRVDVKKGRVAIRERDQETLLAIDGRDVAENQTFNLKDADSRQLLEIYQNITGRTVIWSPGLVHARLDLKSEGALTPVAAEAALAQALKEKGIIVTMRWDKFAFAVPVSHVPRLARLEEPPPPLADPPPAPDGSESFPPGLLKFYEADVYQVAEIYQELTGRTLLHAPDIPRLKVTLRSQTAMSRAEAIWTLKAGLHLGGIAMVPKDKFIFVLPNLREVVLPEFESNSALNPVGDAPLAAGALKFSGASGAEVLKTYAQLLGRTAVVEKVPACRFTLRNQTPLTPAEAIYALDAIAALNHVRFVVSDKEVRLVPAPRTRKVASP